MTSPPDYQEQAIAPISQDDLKARFDTVLSTAVATPDWSLIPKPHLFNDTINTNGLSSLEDAMKKTMGRSFFETAKHQEKMYSKKVAECSIDILQFLSVINNVIQEAGHVSNAERLGHFGRLVASLAQMEPHRDADGVAIAYHMHNLKMPDVDATSMGSKYSEATELREAGHANSVSWKCESTDVARKLRSSWEMLPVKLTLLCDAQLSLSDALMKGQEAPPETDPAPHSASSPELDASTEQAIGLARAKLARVYEGHFRACLVHLVRVLDFWIRINDQSLFGPTEIDPGFSFFLWLPFQPEQGSAATTGGATPAIEIAASRMLPHNETHSGIDAIIGGAPAKCSSASPHAKIGSTLESAPQAMSGSSGFLAGASSGSPDMIFPINDSFWGEQPTVASTAAPAVALTAALTAPFTVSPSATPSAATSVSQQSEESSDFDPPAFRARFGAEADERSDEALSGIILGVEPTPQNDEHDQSVQDQPQPAQHPDSQDGEDGTGPMQAPEATVPQDGVPASEPSA